MAFEDPLWIQSDGSAPVYSAREDRILLSILFNEGVISGMRVRERQAGAQMRVQIESGEFGIQGDDSASPPQGLYLGRWNDDAVDANMPVIGPAPGTGSRRDLVYVRVNDPTHGGPAGRNFTFGVLAGTPSESSPVLPDVPSSAIAIGEVLVASGASSITDSVITDLRDLGGLKEAIPIGAVLDFTGPESAIPSNYVPADGREIDRFTYFGYMRRVGAAHGAGDGSTTVNVADYRGRSSIGLDNMGGTDAGRINAPNTLGGSGGSDSFTLSSANLPPHTHPMGHSHTINHDHGSSGGQSVNHTHGMGHDHSFSDTTSTSGNHNHGIAYQGYPERLPSYTGATHGLDPLPAGQGVATRYQSSIATDGNHNHTVSGRTGGASPGTTSGASTNHSHTLPAYSGSSGGSSASNTGNNSGSSSSISRLAPYILVNKIVKVA